MQLQNLVTPATSISPIPLPFYPCILYLTLSVAKTQGVNNLYLKHATFPDMVCFIMFRQLNLDIGYYIWTCDMTKILLQKEPASVWQGLKENTIQTIK